MPSSLIAHLGLARTFAALSICILIFGLGLFVPLVKTAQAAGPTSENCPFYGTFLPDTHRGRQTYNCLTHFVRGWDDSGQKLDLVNSYVNYWHNDAGFNIVFNLVGAEPNTSYPVGMQIYLDSTSQCKPFEFTNDITSSHPMMGFSACKALERQGISKTYEAFEFGRAETNAQGNTPRPFSMYISGMDPDKGYDMQFIVRTPFSGDCPNCNVIFYSPGPHYGDGVIVSAPEFPSFLIGPIVAIMFIGIGTWYKARFKSLRE